MSRIDPAARSRRKLVKALGHIGLPNKAIASALGLSQGMVQSDKSNSLYTAPRESAFALRIRSWVHWKHNGRMSNELDVLLENEPGLKARIAEVLTQKVMADLNPRVSLLVESLIRPAVDCGGPYEWLFGGAFPVLPSIEELWANVLGAKIDTPATVEEAVLRFVTHVQRRYHDQLAYHGRGGDTSFVQTPIAVRECIDALRAERPEIGELWDAWIAIIEQRRVHSHLKKDRDALRRLDQEERRRHAELHAICMDASPTIAAFSAWRNIGYMGMLHRGSD